MSITVSGVTKRFGNFTALDRVDMEAPSGSLLALVGPSGSGKTTLLRVIAGLEVPDEGTVSHEGQSVDHKSVRERNVGFVFQHYALFRHMTVFENAAFGLRVRKVPQEKVKARVDELLRLVRLDGLAQRYPAQLSGGQRQRVALVRALAAEPRVLLLDEPFGALDARVRQELRHWLRQLHDQLHVTSIFVTHDQEEAFEVADRVVVMRAGRIEQVGTPQEVFDHPANPFVMDFLGNVNVFHGRVHDGRVMLGDLALTATDHGHNDGEAAKLYVRPHELEIVKELPAEGGFRAKVMHMNPAGAVTRVQVHSDEYGLTIHVDVPHSRRAELALTAGDLVYVSPRKVRVFGPEYVI